MAVGPPLAESGDGRGALAGLSLAGDSASGGVAGEVEPFTAALDASPAPAPFDDDGDGGKG